MAFGFFVKVKGQVQGDFKGELKDGRIQGLSYEHDLSLGKGVETGTGTVPGRRQHTPIKFTKEWNAASPQFFQAAVSNETLTEVVFEFIKPDKDGGMTVYQTIKLTNARVAKFHQFKNQVTGNDDKLGQPELEEVSLVFKKIEMENKLGKTMAADEWMTNI